MKTSPLLNFAMDVGAFFWGSGCYLQSRKETLLLCSGRPFFSSLPAMEYEATRGWGLRGESMAKDIDVGVVSNIIGPCSKTDKKMTYFVT